MKKNRINQILSRAKDTISKNERLKELLIDVKGKLNSVDNDTDEKSSFLKQVAVVVRMIRAHYTGQYSAFSGSTILSLVFALVYFITPVDLIPDFIPGLGLSDDISLFYFIFKNLAEDIEDFITWESGKDNRIVDLDA